VMIRSALSVRFGSLMIPGSLQSFGIGDPSDFNPRSSRGGAVDKDCYLLAVIGSVQ